MAGEYTKFKGTPDSIQKVSWVWDFATDPKASGAVLEAIYIPANAVVVATYTECLVAEGGTLAINIGHTGGDVDGFDAAVDLNDVAGPIVGDGAFQAIGGVAYAAADTIDIVLSAAADAAKVRITALMLYPSGS